MRDAYTPGAPDPWDDDAAPVRNTRAARAARAQAAAAPPVELTPAQKLAHKRERRAAVNASHEIRIIGGTWRRSLLPVPDVPGLRPTPDRVRETLFNWLGQDLTGWSVLDAFAGTGVLGFEAASRGAATVQMLERETKLVAGLAASKTRLGADRRDHHAGRRDGLDEARAGAVRPGLPRPAVRRQPVRVGAGRVAALRRAAGLDLPRGVGAVRRRVAGRARPGAVPPLRAPAPSTPT